MYTVTVVLTINLFSSQANSCGNWSGVLEGNWSGDYEGGSSPSMWAGSAAIMEEYMENKETVKYGQCWVFSGLMVTRKNRFFLFNTISFLVHLLI